MLKKVLIANRGEIACRAIATCHKLGLQAVAVYSKVDQDSLHVRLADEAYCIGSAQAQKSYLHIPSLLAVAKASGADAVYPGYGFLAENAIFAQAVANAGFIFIGPPPDAIASMGDKAVARRTMQKAGVAIVPGTEDLITDEQEAKKIAGAIGYPVLLKAVAGGGGKGMRIVNTPEALVKALRQAAAEAERSFGNSGIYLEKYLTVARHVEIQIMADNWGNVVYLGERDCSTQRRHQKLLEEAPSPIIDEKTRKAMGEAAVRAAKAAGYSGAGTVEFIVDEQKNFYFMEMNTRIQVEHPVTEAVTNTDLVEAQFLVAAGAKLPWQQEDLVLRGWAIECRINAEDIKNNFMPCPGKITRYKAPSGEGIRVDSAVYAGYTVSPFYDSMIAKLIVWAPERSQAITRMEQALTEFKIEGIKTTIELQKKLLTSEVFRKGAMHTDYLEKHLDDIL
ncbi:MAG TPA: acetyl-CoA carboxylase biotin carboxylase subunit [Candidatus Avacidaminococcus intestinavium]|uniref:Biotin carboxylase n=1 Tax=Candidatus Avacidaminococcus intestinavium TaxID=2840684 RepID=A0A9D1SLQ5_9FIRM|nr:acetyl-CoA carboxylase biotin carboxylase subunit [Candidatus Avacidaminococcus intestinavium]